MKARLPVILIGTHLLALGAGWWCLGKRDPEPTRDSTSSLATKSERSPRQERRVSTADLLAAYRDPKFQVEAMNRRNAALPQREPPPNGKPSVPMSLEQRAAEVPDIAAAMQKEVEALDGGKPYDYMLAKALITRWMKEDPAACAAWLGQMKMRTGWQDPFSAFAATLPPAELLKLMDQGWLQRNRNMALGALVEHLGKTSPAELPALLAPLDTETAKSFLDGAFRNARVEDAAVWVDLAAGDATRLQSLANRWIQGPGSSWQWGSRGLAPWDPGMADWEKRAEAALAAVAGTPAEEIFRKQLEKQRIESERGRELARVAREPAEASEALVDFYLQQGNDEAEAQRKAAADISKSYQNGLAEWQSEAWDQGLRLSLLGQRELADVLAGRLELIGAELPEVLQAATRNSAWRDAIAIDPATTLEVARQTGRVDEALKSATAVVRNHETSLSIQADILLALAEQGLWEQSVERPGFEDSGKLPNAISFAAGYRRDDPEAARLWIARLPSPLSQTVKEVTR